MGRPVFGRRFGLFLRILLVGLFHDGQMAFAFVLTKRPSSSTTTCFNRPSLSLSWTLLPNDQTTTITTLSESNDQEALPFLIEPLPMARVNPAIYNEIADMCIAAFFNDGNEQQKVPWYKAWQLAYLRNLQSGDLRLRRMERRDSNFMLIARRVVPAVEPGAARDTPLIMDLGRVQNLPPASMMNQDYVRGEILGFVEVTQRPYGLGSQGQDEEEEDIVEHDDDEEELNGPKKYKRKTGTLRPVLTNLSVRYSARRSGVGSALVERCEEEVRKRWNKNEIILEVEDDNLRALEFYKKRGYRVLFEDPTSRRYDVNGLWLQKKRCKRYIMRKELSPSLINVSPMTTKNVKLSLDRGLETLRKVLAGNIA